MANTKNNLSVRRGDTVVVIAGKDKGKKGKIMDVNPDSATIVVDGVNIVTRHKKARSAQQKSAREKTAAPINVSNVMVLCGKCNKATRVGHKEVSGTKVRACGKCGESLDKKFVKTVKDKVKTTDADKEVATEEKKALKKRETKATAESTVKVKEEAPAAE